VYDLLSPNEHMTDDDKGLLVREDATKGVYVEGLAEVEVSDTTEAMDVLRSGLDNRRVASTKMNRVSSRSHALFVLTVRSELFSENGISKVRMSKFTLVDLAGSERQKTTAADGDRLKEACNINNSLLCLGQVINALVDREKGKLNHVAFRNTNLTFLLRDSFGGNSKTCLVATVSPSHASLTETMSTLKFAQRAKLIKNTAVLNENTCGSVADLQSEIARLKAELELKHASIQPVESGDHSMNGIGLPPLAPRSNADAAGKPSNSTIVSALRNQNSMLSKKVKDLRDVSNQREMQVNSLKRKVQQETMIRKCKERRITYLSNKGGTNGIDDSDEVVALREEVAVLQEQVQAQPQHDPIEWMLKYKEEKAKVDEMEANAAITFEPNEKTDMEASLVMLLDERDSLQQKVKEMSNERNVEIDAIINDVTTLENSNVKLQSQLDEKEATIMAHEKTIQSDAAHIDELQMEMKVTLDRLEMTQKELEVEMQKTIELQASVDKMKIEVRDANEAVAEHKGQVDVAQKELVTTKEMHEESLTALNAELLNLRTNLNDAMAENELLLNKVKDVSNDLESKMVELGNLEAAKNEALQQLELGKTKNDADMESFKCREEELMAEIEGMKASFDSILAEKSQAFDTINAQNASLLGEVEELKTTSESLQRRIASTQDTVAALEDEIVLVNIENEQASETHNFVQADLERTIRLQDHSRETQFDAIRHELTINEEIIHCLSREKEITEKGLRSNLNDAMAENELLMKKLKDASECLESKAVEIGNLEAAKNEALEQLELGKSKNDADMESLKLREEELMAEIEGLKASFDSTLAEKSQEFDTVNAQNVSLQGEFEELKTTSESLQRRIASTQDTVAALEDEIFLVNIENEQASNKHIFVQADLERTSRLQDHLRETLFDALRRELAINEETNHRLSREKTRMQNDLDIVSQQLSDKTDEFDGKVALLENDISALRENVSMLKAEKEEAASLQKEHELTVLQLTSENDSLSASVETLKTEFDDLQQLTRAKIIELETKLSEVSSSNDNLNKLLAEVSQDLDEKNTQLQATEEARNEGVQQCSQYQEQHNAAIESFRLRELSLTADITKANETIASLLADKAAAAVDLENAMLHGTSLANEVEEAKSLAASLEKQCAALSSIDAEVARVTAERVELEDRVKASEAKVDQMAAALIAAQCHDEQLAMLKMEKEKIQNELDDLKKRFSEKELAMCGQIEMLESEGEYLVFSRRSFQ
jgi:kinesin family protein 15